jgi:filamentous hemagglutinin
MVRDALYNGSQTTNYVEADDGSLTKVSSYDNVYLNGVTSALSILAGGALASAAGQNTTGAVSAAENEVFNNSLSPKYAKVTAQSAACAGQGKQCYVQALAATQAAYQQAAGDVAAACGAGGDASACNVAKADRAQLYVNQKALAQSVATMTDANTPLSNALHTATLDGLTVLGGAVLGKILPALRSGWNSLSGSAAGASDNVVELTTVGDEPYAGPNGTSDGGMAHPVGSNNAVATNAGKVIIDGKIGGQLEARGWTQQEVQAVVNEGPVGTTMDNRSAGKTPDGLPRNDSASVYGSKSGYVVVNDRTGEVVQVSGKNDPGWIPDSRIKWK